jgi:hypothetical protein
LEEILGGFFIPYHQVAIKLYLFIVFLRNFLSNINTSTSKKFSMKINQLSFIFAFLSVVSYSQETENKINFQDAESERYFLPRESIHLHFNKSTYLSSESIWFKGYVIDKTTGYLNLETTNVYVSLINTEKEIIGTRLFLAANGIINGHWKIDENIDSDNYYIHTYTNFMNNFEEDESSLFAIKIQNTKDSISLKNINPFENASIEFTIEGGSIIFGCNNTIGVSIKDCTGKGIKSENTRVLDGQNNEINRFSTNQQGYGLFHILNTQNEDYKVVLNHGATNIEKTLPRALHEGIALSVHNLYDKNYIVVEVKTNLKTLNKLKNGQYSLVIQKNEQFRVYEFDLENLTTKVSINKEELFNGINFIRLIDPEKKSVAERTVYNHIGRNSEIMIEKHKVLKDSVFIKGRLPNHVANFSISILPEESVSDFENNSIVSQLKLNAYLNNSLKNYSYYFKDFNRTKHFELDIYLIKQQAPKYNWKTFTSSKPIVKYPFEKGLNIEVTLNQTLPQKNKNNYVGNLISPRDMILLKEKLTETNTFLFKNVVAKDSTELVFTLEKNKKPFNDKINIYPRITNNRMKFLKNISIAIQDCNDKIFTRQSFNNFEFPVNSKTIVLDNVDLIQKREEQLNHNKKFGNKQARLVKINPENENQSLVQILTANGYVVNNALGNFEILNFGRTNLSGNPSSPVVYLDDIRLSNLNAGSSNTFTNSLQILGELNTEFIDEIYFNRDDIFESRNGFIGSIKIYTRKDIPVSKKNIPGIKGVKITSGFQHEKVFSNPYTSDFKLESFKKHGTIDWIPNISTDIDGNFEFKFPKLDQDNVVMNIQGIDSEGNLYFENIILELND